MAMGLERRTLGATGIAVPALGVGAGTWGDALQGYGKNYSEDDLYATYRASLDAGFNYFDTAPDYGRGASERLIGRFRKRDGRPVFIATKFENAIPTKPPILGNLEPLFQALDDVARHHKCSTVQVALNWLSTTDPHVIPIPGAKNPRQLSENLASLDWRMTIEECESINGAVLALKR